jgi:hypothetical protein
LWLTTAVRLLLVLAAFSCILLHHFGRCWKKDCLLSIILAYMIPFAAKVATLFSVFTCHVITAANAPECAYYLTKSKLEGAMRGVYAGKNFDVDEHVEAGPVVNVKSAHVR